MINFRFGKHLNSRREKEAMKERNGLILWEELDNSLAILHQFVFFLIPLAPNLIFDPSLDSMIYWSASEMYLLQVPAAAKEDLEEEEKE